MDDFVDSFSDFTDPLSQFSEVDDDTSSLLIVINDPTSLRLFKDRNQNVIAFFVDHIDGLLTLAFADSPLSCRAFSILEHFQPDIFSAMMRHQKFNSIAMTVLIRRTIKPEYLSRMAILTQTALMFSPNDVIEHCGFLLQLLEHLHDSSVFEMFKYMCSEENDQTLVQNWLLEIGFIDLLFQEIDSFKITDSFKSLTRANEEPNLLYFLFKLVSVCSKSPVLGPYVMTQQFVYSLNRNIGDLPLFVEDARWETLCAIYCQDTKEILRGVFQSAIDIISDKSRVRAPSGIAAINILCQFVSKDSVIRPFIAEFNVPETVCQILLDNPGHTILHYAARRFLASMMTVQETSEVTVEKVANFVLTVFGMRQRCLNAIAQELVTDLAKLEKLNPKSFSVLETVPGFYQKIRSRVTYYKKIGSSNYGGHVPLIEPDFRNFLTAE